MTPIKIYYNDYPGQNLAHSGQGTKVWHRNIFEVEKNYKNSLYPILDLLGVPYTFSKEADAIPILDIGSLHPREKLTAQLIEDTASKFKKLLVCSTQEPFQWEDVERLLNRFPNIFIVDAAVPLANNKIFHERYASIPTFLIRSFSPRLHITMCSGDDMSYQQQFRMFSCLLARWRIEKHLLYSLLSYNNLVNDNFVTYRSLFDSDDPELLNANLSTDKRVESYKGAVDILLPSNSFSFKKHAKDGLKSFTAVTLPNDLFVDEAPYDLLEGEMQVQTQTKWHNPIVRAQPKYLFERSFFSLICESFSGADYKVDPVTGTYELLNTRGYITEKTITPLMNGHPWLVFGEVGFYKTMESYGFTAHNELFNLDFDSDPVHGNRLIGIENNLLALNKNFMIEKLQNLDSDTHKKIRHNRYNLFNTSSVMWREVRKNVEHVLDRFRDLDV